MSSSSRRATVFATVTITAFVIWHFCLVFYPPFFDFGRPRLLRHMGIQAPGMVWVFNFLRDHFIWLSAVGGTAFCVVLCFLRFEGAWRWTRTLFVAAAVLFVVNSLRQNEVKFSFIRRVLWIDYLHVLGVLCYFWQGVPRWREVSFPVRPAATMAFTLAALALLFYGIRELTVEDWWESFGGRCSIFVLFSLLVALPRCIAEPLLWSKGVSPRWKILLGLVVVNGFVPFIFLRGMPGHMIELFSDMSIWMHVYFDSLALGLAVAFTIYDLTAMRFAKGSFEVFGTRFPTLESGALLPLVAVDRLLSKRLPPLTRFLICWTLVYGIPAAAVWTAVRGGYVVYVLGPLFPLVGLYLLCVFLSQLLFLLRAHAVRRPRYVLEMGALTTAACCVVVVPGIPEAHAWDEMFLEYSTLEHSVHKVFEPLARSNKGRFKTMVSFAKRHEHRYEVEPAGPSDLEGFNVLFITSDALRAKNLGCYGSDGGASPNIDALAKRSSFFLNAYSPTSHTSGTVQALLTGGINSKVKRELDGTWLGGLLDAGVFEKLVIYNSYMLSISQEIRSEKIELVVDYDLDDRARFRKDLERLKDEQFFFWLHNGGTHVTYKHRADAKDFGSTQQGLYNNNINHLDRFLAFALESLEELDLSKRTVVILSSDHGEHQAEHRIWGHICQTLYEEVIRIPLIVHVPGKAPRVHQDYASLADLGPTLVELFGHRVTSKPEWVVSHRSTILGEATSVGERWLPVRSWNYGGVGILRSDGRKFFVTHDAEFFFDIRAEPHEHRNLLRHQPERAAEPRRQCYEFFGMTPPALEN